MTRNYELTSAQYTAIFNTRETVLAAFKVISKANFYARSNFLCCGGCAGADLATRMQEADAAGKPRNGAAFWHRQDENHFQERGCLYIRFGANDEYSAINPATNARWTDKEVGDFVAKTLREAGLDISWDGDPVTCITVFAFRTIENHGIDQHLVVYGPFDKVGPEVPDVPAAVRLAFREANKVVYADLQSRSFLIELIGQLKGLPELAIDEAEAWLKANPDYFEYALRSSLRTRFNY